MATKSGLGSAVETEKCAAATEAHSAAEVEKGEALPSGRSWIRTRDLVLIRDAL
jgi:hypothetical protein